MKSKFVNNVLLLIVIFCSLASDVWGQKKLDEVIESNIKLEQEIKSLQDELRAIRDSASKITANIHKDSVLLIKVINERDSLNILNSKEFLVSLQHKVDSLCSCDSCMQVSLNIMKCELDSLKQLLDNNKSAIDNMTAFAIAQKQKIYEQNLEYLKLRYSQMNYDKLWSMKENAKEFTDDPLYVKRVEFALSAFKLYSDANEAIKKSFDRDKIGEMYRKLMFLTNIKEDTLRLGIFKFNDNQLPEMVSMRIKLSRFDYGRGYLQNMIKEINSDEKIVKLRKDGTNRDELLRRIKTYVIPEEGSDRAKQHQRYFDMVPYLNNLLQSYWSEIKINPFRESSTEEKILNMSVE